MRRLMNVKRVMFVVISLIALMLGMMLLVTATSSGSVDTALSSGNQTSGEFPTPTPTPPLGLEPPETNGKAQAQGPLPTLFQPMETDGKAQAQGPLPTPSQPMETDGKAQTQGPLPMLSQPVETDGKAQADLGARPSDLTPPSSIEEPNHIKLETPTGE
jgi:hypothetical protein